LFPGSFAPQVRLEDWSRQNSPIHSLDARAKVVCCLVLLIGLALSRPVAWTGLCILVTAILLPAIAVCRSARIPTLGVFQRAFWVLPFVIVFSILSAFNIGILGGLTLLTKCVLSALIVVITIATTRLEYLLAALQWMRAPGLVLSVVLFVYRYLFVIGDEARRMTLAAAARGSDRSFQVAAGSVAVLFGRSYQRAETIHRAMIARGFSAQFTVLPGFQFTLRDALAIGAATIVAGLIPVLVNSGR